MLEAIGIGVLEPDDALSEALQPGKRRVSRARGLEMSFSRAYMRSAT